MPSPDMPAGDDLRAELLAELSSFGPTQQMHMARHWPAGRLSLIHLNVLYVLSSEGPLAMNRLAELLDVSGASATGIVDRMEQRGLVTRERDGEDRRVVRVVISGEGESLIAGISAQRRDKVAQMLAGLDDADATALLQGLRAMRRAREAYFAQSNPSPAASSEAPR